MSNSQDTQASTIDTDAPAVNNDAEIAAKVQAVLEEGPTEVTETYYPIGVLNRSTNEDGTFSCAAVIDKDGIPKQIDNINTNVDTSVQVFDAEAGDILLVYNEGSDEIQIKAKETDGRPIEELVAPEFLEITMDFLKNVNGEQYYIIDGHNAVINGFDMNEAFRRRRHLAEVLKGLTPPLDDQLANWIDRSSVIDIDTLNWSNASRLESDSLELMIDYNLDGSHSSLTSKFAVVWREIGGKSVGELLQINMQPATYLAGSKQGNITVSRILELDEHIHKALLISQCNDMATSVTFFNQEGAPESAMPYMRYTEEVSHHRAAMRYFGLDEEYCDKDITINSPLTVFEESFTFGRIKAMMGGLNYVETRAFIEDDIEVLDLESTSGRKQVPEGGYAKPMVHLFKSKSNDDVYVTVFLNVPEDALDLFEENNDGTIAE